MDARPKAGHDGVWSRAEAYTGLAFLCRLVVAGGFCCGLALRFLVMDCWLLPSWDAGWRPWRLRSWTVLGRIWLYRLYALLGRALPSLGLRNRLWTFHAMGMIRLRNGHTRRPQRGARSAAQSAEACDAPRA